MSSNSSAIKPKNLNDNEASFETSFADDVNGAAFKSLLKYSNSNTASNTNNNDVNNYADQNSLNPLHFDPPANSSGSVAVAGGEKGTEDNQTPEDLNLFISDLLEQMQSKFETMGNTILGRIDDMGSRIDTLEKSIGDLMDQSGLSEPTIGSSGGAIKKSDHPSDD